MTEATATNLTEKEISLTAPAQAKMAELIQQVQEPVEGVRVYAAPGGCSGINFGMTFTDQINDNDGVLQYDGFKVVVDNATLEYLRGVQIDFVDRDMGQASFVFNNLPPMPGASGCSSCGSSQGGGCS